MRAFVKNNYPDTILWILWVKIEIRQFNHGN